MLVDRRRNVLLRKARNVRDFRDMARRVLPRVVFDHIDGGGDDEITLRDNEGAFRRLRLVPKVLTGVGTPDLGTNVLGQSLSLPLLLAPTGMSGFASWQGEVASASGAEACGTRLVLSTASAYSIEEVSRATREAHWFQLYPWGDRAMISGLVGRAQEAGYHALCVTVDVPQPGNRERDRRNGLTTHPKLGLADGFDLALHMSWWSGYLRHRRFNMKNLDETQNPREALASVGRFVGLFNPEMRWSDLEWIRSLWHGPLLVKGIMHPDDAARSVEAGADGVIVSNHGGRQLDTTPATLDQLPRVVDRVGSRVPVLVDGGVRRGSDIAKALCLGAQACLIGRPYLYGLAVAGQQGVEAVVERLRVELVLALTLLGCPSAAALDGTYVEPPASPEKGSPAATFE
jgi:L-lactate dehydrogenase (cytochrome)/(S)-mandelate dehydrogenase